MLKQTEIKREMQKRQKKIAMFGGGGNGVHHD